MASHPVMRTSASEEDLVHGGVARNIVTLQKFPIQRLKPAISKFQTVLQIDLDRLEKHRNNIDRLTALEDWVGLHKEQVNASRTVQQVKATLYELERTRSQVADKDVDKFDEQVQEAKIKAVAAIERFLRISHADQLLPDMTCAPDHIDSRESSSLPAHLPSHEPFPALQTHIELHVVPENSQAAASGEELLKDMEELNELVHRFADIVTQQGEVVDRIDDNIEQAQENIREGTEYLGLASKYKVAVYPVVGALIGGVVAGPVGFLAGAKFGGLAAAGGGVAGFVGGKLLKARHKRVVTMEMNNLSKRSEVGTPQRSTSTPELLLPSPPETSNPEQQDSDSLDQSVFGNFFSWGQRKSYSQSDA